MKGAAHRMAGNEEQRRALRVHNRRYQLTESDRRKLQKALEYLAALEQPVSLALQDSGDIAQQPDQRVRLALTLLITGPEGEFR